MTASRPLDRLAAPGFVLLWSTGFIGAKLGLPYAEPMTFLALRFAIVAAALGLWTLLARSRWPTGRQWGDAALIGLLMHVGYLGGVFAAIDLGVEAGAAALIVGLQPVVTALLAAPMLGERLTRAKVAGLGLGVAGVGMVVAPKLAAGIGDLRGVGLCLLALVSISLGSILQKRRGGDIPHRAGATVQFAAAFLATGALALAFETRVVVWTGEFLFALAWLAVVLSVGAISLLYLLIRRGAASQVASLFFLVPPATALVAWAVFGEVLGPVELAGFALTAVAVALVLRST